jgi:ABC-type antimicrobial peptide transport system permease subunit
MSKWHLQSEFKNGINVGGRIEFVWLFGIIGVFVLMLACINFMNLSTARSEKRAKEVGIRKSIGSVRGQLISQFFSESLVVASLAFLFSLLLVLLILPSFNQVADKKLTLPWLSPSFWLIGLVFSLLTGIIAGSYPALYLSSFNPVQVLKGTFRVGRFASVPRKVLVVLQFTVSVTLIIGTVIVFNQIQHAKSRPIGYDRNGLISMFMSTEDIHNHFDAVRNELKASGAVVEMTESGSPVTQVWNTNGGFDWKGKDPSLAVDFPNNGVTYEYGKTIGWQYKEGRDFSRDHSTDSLAFVINEAAAKFLGFKNAVGETLIWEGKPYIIIGIINDMVVESPYEPARASLFHIARYSGSVIMTKINPDMSSREALAKIEGVFKKYNPEAPFEYKFVDEDYARKFSDEERIGKLASFFAALAIFISCLGIFGLASFVAEQKAKEIGVRKVLGASVFTLWKMLSRDFLLLVTISLLIAIPTSFYLMSGWLSKYQYRTEISWWIFAVASGGALSITLATVSYQAIKAAVANPVNSLRME